LAVEGRTISVHIDEPALAGNRHVNGTHFGEQNGPTKIKNTI
jgi:hypothetical protein